MDSGIEAKVTVTVLWHDGRETLTSDYLFEETASEDFSETIACQLLHAIESGRRQMYCHEWTEAQRLSATIPPDD